MQAKTFSTKDFCPPSVSSCVTPTTLTAINPVDVPDALNQFSGSIGGPLIKDKTFFFVTADYTRQDRTTFLSSTLPAFLLPADGHLDYTGHYRQALFNGRLDHKLTAEPDADVPHQRRSVLRRQSAGRGRRHQRAAAWRAGTRGGRWTGQVNHTAQLSAESAQRSALRLSRMATRSREWEAQTLSTTYTRAGSVPFTIGQSRVSDLFGHQAQFSDTLSWSHGSHYVRFGGSVVHHTSGGFGSEPGTAVLGTFTFQNTTTAPFDQLTLADVQQYTQPINFGITSYDLKQWLYAGFVQDSIHVRRDLTLDLGLRYDRQTLTDATKDFAPRVGFGWHPGGDSRAVRSAAATACTTRRSSPTWSPATW